MPTRPNTGRAGASIMSSSLGFGSGAATSSGNRFPIGEAAEHIAGFCLLNDWSARDIQAWEYQPLGPFLAKNFLTSVSPWVVSPQALAPFRKAMPTRPPGDPQPLPYLDDPSDRESGGIAIQLEATLSTDRMRAEGLPPHVLSRGSADAAMYWSAAQIVAHHSSNGCNLQPGDLIGTGTLSTDNDGGLGSLLEISRGRQAAGGATERRNPHLPRGWRRSDPARLVRGRRRGPHRPRRMRRPRPSAELGSSAIASAAGKAGAA